MHSFYLDSLFPNSYVKFGKIGLFLLPHTRLQIEKKKGKRMNKKEEEEEEEE